MRLLTLLTDALARLAATVIARLPNTLKRAIARLGDSLAEKFGSPRYTRIHDLALIIAEYGGNEYGFDALNCHEVDALAALLAEYGFERLAVDKLHSHSVDDDEDDPHGYFGGNWDSAVVYLKRLRGDSTAQPHDEADKRAELAQLIAAARDDDAGLDLDDGARLVQLCLELGETTDGYEPETTSAGR